MYAGAVTVIWPSLVTFAAAATELPNLTCFTFEIAVPPSKPVPVTITEERRVKAVKVVEAASPSPLGTIEIKLGKGNVHIAGRVDLVVLRTALECLLG